MTFGLARLTLDARRYEFDAKCGVSSAALFAWRVCAEAHISSHEMVLVCLIFASFHQNSLEKFGVYRMICTVIVYKSS
jgi:hypothetical protein